MRSALRGRSAASLALRIGAPLLLLVQALASCGSDDPESSVCVPNASQACTGAGQCVGFQVCADDGKSFGACDCGSGGTGGTASGGTGGSGGGGGTSNAGSSGMSTDPLFPGGVGLPCVSDADCPGAPMVCIQSTSNEEFGGGGPQGGYCSAPCTRGGNECLGVDDQSGCGLIDPATNAGYCLGLCTPGAGQTKCGSGRAQACFQSPNNAALGLCLPVCTSDASCGAGRFCDPGGIGLCVDEAPPGGAVGAPCTEATQATDCASGICFEGVDPANPAVVIGAFCTANCTFNVLNGCGFDAVSGGVREAACLQPQIADGQAGDIGFCLPLCDTTADCLQSDNGWVCQLFDDPRAVEQLGRQGECLPAALATPGAPDAGPG